MADTKLPMSEPQSDLNRHLFGPGRKHILALDGGGVRGAISVGFLERIEALLSESRGKDVRLGDYFDLIGGTSTGSIIAGALALGHRIDEVKDFYLRLAPYAFKRQLWHIPILQAKFDARGLRKEIEGVIGDRVLSTPDLITGLALVTKRLDTGSPWIISNNPRAPYWEDAPDHIGNKHYPLANLVRASTAAPHFFDPELLAISRNEILPDYIARPMDRPWFMRLLAAVHERLMRPTKKKVDPNIYGLFVDGGVTPHNNPALALLQLATLKPFRICWPASPEQLSITSIGTGSFRPRLSYEQLGFAGVPKLALHSLISMISDAQTLVLELLQWMGECPAPWVINSEVGTLADSAPPGGKMFRFIRYDVHLERQWLSDELGYPMSENDAVRFRTMDDPGIVKELYELGKAIAARHVKAEHWQVPR